MSGKGRYTMIMFIRKSSLSQPHWSTIDLFSQATSGAGGLGMTTPWSEWYEKYSTTSSGSALATVTSYIGTLVELNGTVYTLNAELSRSEYDD